MSTDLAREAYARLVTDKADPAMRKRLVAAFAQVPREDYLPPPPWRIHGGGAAPLVTSDAAQLYRDALVGICGERGINNGQPSLHAECLAAVAPQPGEAVVHVGAGLGYYTAILARLVGAGGRVAAYEIEPDLAARAAANLRHLAQVHVVAGSGAAAPLPGTDIVYVSAGATHPCAAWLDALHPGGRLVVPLTPHEGWGCMLLVTRRSNGGYAAAALMRVAFIPCIGARDDAAAASVAQALQRRPLHEVRSLRRGTPPDETVWCAGNGWWLSTAQAP